MISNLKLKRAKGDMEHCANEIKEVFGYLSEQFKAGEIPTEDDVAEYQEMLSATLTKLDESCAVLRKAEKEKQEAEEARKAEESAQEAEQEPEDEEEVGFNY